MECPRMIKGAFETGKMIRVGKMISGDGGTYV